MKNLLDGCTRDSRVKPTNVNVETAKDVNNTPGSPKEKCSRVDEEESRVDEEEFTRDSV